MGNDKVAQIPAPAFGAKGIAHGINNPVAQIVNTSYNHEPPTRADVGETFESAVKLLDIPASLSAKIVK